MLTDLADACRSSGLPVIEMAGWKTRGYAGQSLRRVDGPMWHHTATGRNAFLNNDAPTLNLCINGRSDLPGPLCNIVFGRKANIYVIAAGVANHAGYGQAPGIPINMGNHYYIGIEMESSGVAPWDWTPEQLEGAPRLGAALERWYLMDRPPEERYQLGHYEYSSVGKIDPAGWPGGMDGFRASVNQILEGEDVALSQDDINKIGDHIFNRTFQRQGPVTPGTLALRSLVEWYDANNKQIFDRIDQVEDKIANISVGGVDLNALATLVADKLAERLKD